MPVHTLSCSGCSRSVRSRGSLSAADVARLVSWERADDGCWCSSCQWRQGRIPGFAWRAAHTFLPGRVPGRVDLARFTGRLYSGPVI
jgi:hypothetical protein